MFSDEIALERFSFLLLFFLFCISAYIHRNLFGYHIISDTYQPAGKVSGRTGMVGNDLDFVTDFQRSGTIDFDFANFFRKAINCQFCMVFYNAESSNGGTAVGPLIQSQTFCTCIAKEHIFRRMGNDGGKNRQRTVGFCCAA